jgi:hypothetical protein
MRWLAPMLVGHGLAVIFCLVIIRHVFQPIPWTPAFYIGTTLVADTGLLFGLIGFVLLFLSIKRAVNNPPTGDSVLDTDLWPVSPPTSVRF